jgi:hypothetical protein
VHDRDPRPTAQERRGERELLELSADVHGAPPTRPGPPARA